MATSVPSSIVAAIFSAAQMAAPALTPT